MESLFATLFFQKMLLIQPHPAQQRNLYVAKLVAPMFET